MWKLRNKTNQLIKPLSPVKPVRDADENDMHKDFGQMLARNGKEAREKEAGRGLF